MKFTVAVDGSDEGDEALEYAINLAKPISADIEAVHVVVPEIYSENGDALVEDMSEAEDRAEKILQDAKEIGEENGVSIDTAILYGDPAEEISEHTTDSDCIFIGHRGLSGKFEKMVGSVAHELVRKASVPVTVVR